MKVTYDRETDILSIELRDGRCAESDEASPGVICDYDRAGNLLAIEILAVSKRKLDLSNWQIQLGAGKLRLPPKRRALARVP